jgi:hypothetical protein
VVLLLKTPLLRDRAQARLHPRVRNPRKGSKIRCRHRISSCAHSRHLRKWSSELNLNCVNQTLTRGESLQVATHPLQNPRTVHGGSPRRLPTNLSAIPTPTERSRCYKRAISATSQHACPVSHRTSALAQNAWSLSVLPPGRASDVITHRAVVLEVTSWLSV